MTNTNQEDKRVETFSVKQVAEILGVSRQTVYKYGKQGELNTCECPYSLNNRIMFTRDSVYKIKEKREQAMKEVKGFSLTSLAEEWNIQRHRLSNLLKAKNLPYQVDSEHFQRKTIVVSEDVKNQLKQLVSEHLISQKHAKLDFSKPSWNIAIYQKFYDEHGEERRLIRNHENGKINWGFLLSEEFLSYQEAINKGYKTAYPMSRALAKKNHGYSKFRVLKYDKLTFTFLDFLYEHWGINNLYIENVNNTELILYVREGTNHIDLSSVPITHEWLVSNLIDGEVSLNEGVLNVGSNKKYITYYLHIDKYNVLKEIAKKDGNSINEEIESAIDLLIDIDKNKKSHL